jgi:hypothetical protein
MAGYQRGVPLGGQGAQEAAHPDDAFGIHAVEGLVQDQHRRVAQQRGGDAEPLPHAERVTAGPAANDRRQAGLRGYRVHPGGGQALRAGQPEQVVAAGAARLERGRVQQRADMGERMPQCAVGLTANGRRTGIGRFEAEDDTHRGGLARPVRADETGDLP